MCKFKVKVKAENMGPVHFMCFFGFQGSGGYSCECSRGYYGSTCERYDPCASMPCLNGGGMCSLYNEAQIIFSSSKL